MYLKFPGLQALLYLGSQTIKAEICFVGGVFFGHILSLISSGLASFLGRLSTSRDKLCSQ